MTVSLAAMYDPDTEDRTEALNTIGTYEWAISDGQSVGGLYEKWSAINNFMKINTTYVSETFIIDYFQIQLFFLSLVNNLKKIFFLKDDVGSTVLN